MISILTSDRPAGKTDLESTPYDVFSAHYVAPAYTHGDSEE